MIRVIRKTKNTSEVNFRRTIAGICRYSTHGMFNAFEVGELLQRANVDSQNNGKPITKGFLHQWFERIGYRRSGDWWYVK